MKKLLATTFSSLLTFSSFTLAISPQANALRSNFVPKSRLSSEFAFPNFSELTLFDKDVQASTQLVDRKYPVLPTQKEDSSQVVKSNLDIELAYSYNCIWYTYPNGYTEYFCYYN